MTAKMPYEIPGELRDFAEKSMDQARKAFDGFISAAYKAAEQADGASEKARASAMDAATKAIKQAETNVNASFELAQRLARAKDFAEILQIQQAFVQEQMSVFQTQMTEFGKTVQKAASKAK
jgi:phasin